jgi:hypothetical protein
MVGFLNVAYPCKSNSHKIIEDIIIGKSGPMKEANC